MKPSLTILCVGVICILLPCGILSAQPRSDEQPNILFLLADDQRWDSIGAHGNTVIQTPNIDQLARQGFSFSNAYCFGSPHGAVCIPSRAMLHTGRSLFRLSNLNMDGYQTLGEILGEHGYETFATGKWHNGRPSFVKSFQQGRNIMFGGMSNHAEVPIVQLDRHEMDFSAVEVGQHFSSKLFADAAIQFLYERDIDRPFFCYVSFTAPHDPRMSPGNFNRMYQPDEMPLPKNFLPQHPFNNGDLTTRDENLGAWPRTPEMIRAQTADYFGLVSHLDEQVGRILEALRETDVLKNTIIIYAADHGLGLGSHGLLGKQNLYEHSMKAPLFVVGPGIAPGQSEALVYLYELFPTLLEFAGVADPAEKDGQSLVPLIHGNSERTRDYLFTAYGTSMRAVRDIRWKLIRYPQIHRTQLFDLKNDPDEIHDLSESKDVVHRTEFERLSDLMVRAQQEFNDTQPLSVDQPQPAEIDLTGRERKPDQWQPRWIVEKYFKD